MKITNNQNLPAPIVRAVSRDEYTNGGSDFTITGLLKPPRIVALERLHKDKLEEDASDRIWSLIGKVGHSILQSGATGDIVEKRFFAELSGQKISGQFDYGINGELFDFKFVSVWVAKEGAKPDWVAQLNGYRWLAHKNKVDLGKLSIVAIYRDWSKNESRRNSDYPQAQCQTFDIPVWSLEITENFFKNRIALHLAARKELPLCTEDERWAKEKTWAVFKGKNVRATKVHYSEAMALAHVQTAGENHHIVFRPGENVRCDSYCAVSKFCSWYQSQKPQQPTTTETEKF